VASRFPPPLDTVPDEDLDVLERYVTEVRFAAGACIFMAGDPGDSCYIVDEGVVSVKLEQLRKGSEVDSEDTFGYVDAGQILGELALLDGLPRSASAYAETDVVAREIQRVGMHQLAIDHPRAAVALYRALGQNVAGKLRANTERLAAALFHDVADPEVEEMVAKAVAAQKAFASWPEDRVDAMLHDMAHAIGDRADEFSREVLAETGIGNLESKIVKKKAASLATYAMLVGRPGFGPIAVHPDRRVTDIAAPVGVVFGIVPVTNPVSTLIFKSLICVKSRNALILSPHRGALKVSGHAADVVHDVLVAHGAPADLVQSVRHRASRKKTAQFMEHRDVALILATGGASLVKSAYSSGKPAIGVGPGNTPVLICPDADLPVMTGGILESKTFDNGLPCGAENNLVVVASVRDALVAELTRQGTAVLDAAETAAFTAMAVDAETGHFAGHVVGQPAAALAERAGITRPYPIRLIVVPCDAIRADNPYAHEKVAPFLSLFAVPDVDAGIEACRALLEIDGCGHTAAIHTQDRALAERYGIAMPAGRILVNSPCSQGIIGLTTGLDMTAMLGCGTFGGNSTTDNVGYQHLQNIKRLAWYWPERVAQIQRLFA
jgi:acyl-CoA reductase-like NAD-dependent aldehyde dehydrogenase